MKKVQIIIISLVVVLTLACGTFAILYFATDTFKSDQELFYKYISQVDLKELIDLESYSNYINRTKTEGHSNNGEFRINITQGEQATNETITYTGYSDPTNQKSSSQISINRDEENLLAMNYLRNQDLYGLQFVDVINQYVVVENNNLKEFVAKLGITNTDSIPNKIENLESTSISFEEIKPVLNKYINIAIEQIPEGKYSKIESTSVSLGAEQVGADGYEVTLNMEDLKNIITSSLETAKNDQETYNFINKLNGISFEEYQSKIDEILSEMDGEINGEENTDFMTISVYKQGKDTIKVFISVLPEDSLNLEISIDKASSGLMLVGTLRDTESGQEVSMDVTKTVNSEEQEITDINIIIKENNEETGNYNINLNRTGALTSSNITNNMSFTTSVDGTDVAIELSNKTDFSLNQEIEDFTEGNYLVINDLPQDQINNLFSNLQNILSGRLQNELIISLIQQFSLSMQMQQATNEMNNSLENAIEEESALNSGTVNINGQEVPIEEYYTE